MMLINDVKAVVTAVRNRTLISDDTFAMPNFQLGKLDGTLAVFFENNVDPLNDPFTDLDHDTVAETS